MDAIVNPPNNRGIVATPGVLGSIIPLDAYFQTPSLEGFLSLKRQRQLVEHKVP